MRYTMENEFLTVEADTMAGELRAVKSKKSGKDYLWTGDPKYWAYCAPPLFPIVCAAMDDEIRVDGQVYNISKHGFVRANEFALVEHTKDTMVFELRETPETLKMYPYNFILRFIYKLRGSKVYTTLEAENVNDRVMHFSIGGHPALNCPFNPGEAYGDYYLEFDEKETLDAALFDGPYLNGTKRYLVNENKIPMNHDALRGTTLIFANYRSAGITLRSSKSDNNVRMNIDGFPYVGIWTMTDPDAPYICVEPWYGIPDITGYKGELSDKKGVVTLEAGKSFACTYSIEVNE